MQYLLCSSRLVLFEMWLLEMWKHHYGPIYGMVLTLKEFCVLNQSARSSQWSCSAFGSTSNVLQCGTAWSDTRWNRRQQCHSCSQSWWRWKSYHMFPETCSKLALGTDPCNLISSEHQQHLATHINWYINLYLCGALWAISNIKLTAHANGLVDAPNVPDLRPKPLVPGSPDSDSDQWSFTDFSS